MFTSILICLPSLASKPTTPSTIARATTTTKGIEFSCVILGVRLGSVVSLFVCELVGDGVKESVGVIVGVEVKLAVRVGVGVGVMLVKV